MNRGHQHGVGGMWAGSTETTAQHTQRAPSKKPQNVRVSRWKGTSENMQCSPHLTSDSHMWLPCLCWSTLCNRGLNTSSGSFLRKFPFVWSWHLPPRNRVLQTQTENFSSESPSYKREMSHSCNRSIWSEKSTSYEPSGWYILDEFVQNTLNASATGPHPDFYQPKGMRRSSFN